LEQFLESLPVRGINNTRIFNKERLGLGKHIKSVIRIKITLSNIYRRALEGEEEEK